MTEMVERVAREAFEANMTICQATLGFRHDEHWETTPEPNRELWRAVARASISAMREPTDAMLDGQARTELLNDRMKHPRRTKAQVLAMIYRAMIDEALR